MKKIDFRHFKMFTDIAQEKTVEEDVHATFSDLLYKNLNGIQAHDLALRIYRAEGPVELSEDDLSLLNGFVESGFTPLFIDSFRANIHD